jgi:hypothetical protein
MSEGQKAEGKKRPEADPNTPPEQQEYPPAKARLLDKEEELASQSDDEPALE